MLIDARSLPQDHVVSTDVCIVGSGPAGLTLARELAGGPLRVTVLESGSGEAEQTDAATRSQLTGTLDGTGYAPLDSIRAQGVGGTTALWNFNGLGLRQSVRLRPLEAEDFERRSWIAHSGWPFGLDELDPYYRRAEDAFGIGRFARDVHADSPDARAHPFAVGDLNAREFRFANRADFLRSHRPALESAPNVETYLHATVTELDCSGDAGRVGRAMVRTAPGHRFAVTARWFVLAGGGVDNARLLLESDATHRSGIGNEHDLVGRYYMDHPHAFGAHLTLRDPADMERLHAYDTRVVGNIGLLKAIALDAEVLEREQLLHSWVSLHPRVNLRYRNALHSARDVFGSLRSPDRLSAAPRAVARNAGNIVRGIEPFARAVVTRTRRGKVPIGWSSRPRTDRIFADAEIELIVATEQSPDPASRITLGTARDRLGMRLPHLEYRWSESDLANVRRSVELMGKELANAGVGEVGIETERAFPDRSHPNSPHHPTGTTRMHRDPRHGVVDEHGRVHGMANLSVVGSSTFPTSGSANPTLTIVALAIRMADRLSRTLS